MNGTDLGHSVDDVKDLRPEFFFNDFCRGQGIFNRVMEQSGGNSDLIQFHLGQQPGHFQRMGQVGLPGQPNLSFMHFG